MKKTLRAAAKINLCLHVTGKREDGYHDLTTLMQPVDLFDRVTLTVGGGRGIEVVCPGLELERGAENTAARAAREIFGSAQREAGVRIEIEKNIPVAAGLGGGSSDAAAVLVGLNEMLRLDLDRPALMRLGRRVGADVPFFVYGEAAWATGIGDRLEPAGPLPAVWYLLVNPGIVVSTSSVFGAFRGDGGRRTLPRPGTPANVGELLRLLHNDLEKVTMARLPVLGDIKERLLESGAAGALMSGSGPTVFGIFEDEKSARRAASSMVREARWRLFVVSPGP